MGKLQSTFKYPQDDKDLVQCSSSRAQTELLLLSLPCSTLGTLVSTSLETMMSVSPLYLGVPLWSPRATITPFSQSRITTSVHQAMLQRRESCLASLVPLSYWIPHAPEFSPQLRLKVHSTGGASTCQLPLGFNKPNKPDSSLHLRCPQSGCGITATT